MARTIQLAVAAAQLALDDAAVDQARLDPARFGVEFGAGLIPGELAELGRRRPGQPRRAGPTGSTWRSGASRACRPSRRCGCSSTCPTCWPATSRSCTTPRGRTTRITESDAASLLALGEAYRILRRDQADFFLVGGAESKINPLSLVRQCLFEPLSRRNDAPEKACRPFDRGRDGLVLGEGAGVLVLEELEHARTPRRPHLRRGGRLRRRLRPRPHRRRPGPGHPRRAGRGGHRPRGARPRQRPRPQHGRRPTPGRRAACRRSSAPAVACRCSRRRATSATSAPAAARPSWRPACWRLEHGVVPATLNYEEPDPACPVHGRGGEPRPVHAAVRAEGRLHRDGPVRGGGAAQVGVDSRSPRSIARRAMRPWTTDYGLWTMHMRRRVVITGMGAITPLGHSVEELFAAQLEGRSGVGPITPLRRPPLPDARSPPRSRTSTSAASCTTRGRWDDSGVNSQFAAAAAQQALDDAGLLDDAPASTARASASTSAPAKASRISTPDRR